MSELLLISGFSDIHSKPVEDVLYTESPEKSTLETRQALSKNTWQVIG